MLVCLVDNTQLLHSLQMRYLAEEQHNCPQTKECSHLAHLWRQQELFKKFCENDCHRPHLLFA